MYKTLYTAELILMQATTAYADVAAGHRSLSLSMGKRVTTTELCTEDNSGDIPPMLATPSLHLTSLHELDIPDFDLDAMVGPEGISTTMQPMTSVCEPQNTETTAHSGRSEW